MKLLDIQVGFKFEHPTKGTGEVIKRTSRTLTIKFKRSTSKVTYDTRYAIFNPNF